MTKKKLSWKAIHKGELYCSPACGAGCTYKEYLEVNAKADALIIKCEAEVGGKWVKRIHENLGWHYSVSLKGGNITIHEYFHGSDRNYTVSSHYGGTPLVVHVGKSSKSIKKLVLQQLIEVKTEANKWNKYLAKNIKALKPKEIPQ